MKKIRFLLFLVVISFLSSAQVPEKVGDALDSVTFITAIAQSEKYKWIGTNNGLIKIKQKNNKRTVLRKSNSSLPSDFITSICFRKDENVWIGTPKGIIIFDGSGLILINKENSNLPDEFITAILEDKNSDLWIGTKNGGLVRGHHSRFKVYNKNNSSLTCDTIKVLSIDNNGNVIVDGLNWNHSSSKTILSKL